MPTIWYTQPPRGFSSYYYYLPESPLREMVRIRLELERDDDGSTGAHFTPFARVGFSPYTFTSDKRRKFRVTSDGEISVPCPDFYRPPGYQERGSNHTYLYKDPIIGYRVYDFPAFDGDTKPRVRPHMGNAVIDALEANLPPGIRGDDLEKLAKLCLKHPRGIRLTGSHAQPQELANEIIRLVRPGSVMVTRCPQM